MLPAASLCYSTLFLPNFLPDLKENSFHSERSFLMSDNGKNLACYVVPCFLDTFIVLFIPQNPSLQYRWMSISSYPFKVTSAYSKNLIFSVTYTPTLSSGISPSASHEQLTRLASYLGSFPLKRTIVKSLRLEKMSKIKSNF